MKTESVVNELIEKRYEEVISVFQNVPREECLNKLEKSVASFSRQLDQLEFPVPNNVRKRGETATSRIFEFVWDREHVKFVASVIEDWANDKIKYSLQIENKNVPIWVDDQTNPANILGALVLFKNLL